MTRKKLIKPVRVMVSFDLPEDATMTEAKEYVLNAVITYCGSLMPNPCNMGDGTWEDGDPMFDLDRSSVKVWSPRRLTAKKKVDNKLLAELMHLNPYMLYTEHGDCDVCFFCKVGEDDEHDEKCLWYRACVEVGGDPL